MNGGETIIGQKMKTVLFTDDTILLAGTDNNLRNPFKPKHNKKTFY